MMEEIKKLQRKNKNKVNYKLGVDEKVNTDVVAEQYTNLAAMPTVNAKKRQSVFRRL